MEKYPTFLKKDTKKNWDKAVNFIPKDGEIIQYTDTHQVKIGNGKDKLNQLSFLNNYQYVIQNDTLIIKEDN